MSVPSGRCSAFLSFTVWGGLLGNNAIASAQTQQAAVRPLVIDQVTVVDVEQGRLVPMQRVVVTGHRIQVVGPVEKVQVPADAQVIDAHGKYLMPGLWDMHVHALDASSLVYPLLLANGVTGFRDPGSPVPLDTLLQWRREILAGTRVGPPRQILSGPAIDGMAPCVREKNSGHICVTDDDTADVRHVIDSLKAAGADMIKPYTLSGSMYAVVAAMARRAGLPFGGHTPVAASVAAASGAATVDHPFMAGIDTSCWNRTATVSRCRSIADLFQRGGTWWVPTIVRSRIEQQPETMEEWSRSAPISEQLSQLGHEFWEDSAAYVATRHRKFIDSAPASDSALGALRIAREVGLPILAGTDATGEFASFSMMSVLMGNASHPMKDITPGFSLHAEIAIYAAEGLTPAEALRTATLNPAKMFHATDSLGTVASGKLADLVLLDADPLAAITNTTTIRAVVANGRYFDRDALDRMLFEVRAKAPTTP